MSRIQSSLLIIIVLLAFCSLGNATTYYVDTNGNNGNGLSWSSAKTTLQGAISASSTGDDILVKYGTYSVGTAISVYTNRRISSDDGSASSFDTANPDSSLCIMQGDGTSRIFRIYSSNITNECRIRGFKITGGNASDESYWAAAGGGLVVYDGAGPTIENCWITNNYGNTNSSPGSGSPGGGMYFNDVVDAVLRNCLVSNNIASTNEQYGGSGGGMFIEGSATLEGNIFRSNIAVQSAGSQYYNASGGAVLHRDGTLIFTGNLVEGNAAVSRSVSLDRANWGISCTGGGLDLYYASYGIIRNNVFKNNVALLCPDYNQYTGQSSSGSAGALSAGSTGGIIENNTFIGNNGGSLYAYNATLTSGALTFGTNDIVRNNIFVDNDDYSQYAVQSYPNGLSLDYNCFYDNSLNYGAGILSTNEVTSNPEFTNQSGGDYSLLNTSPCIDAGAPVSDTTGYGQDYAGGYRISRDLIDIGAFEYQFPLPVDSIPEFTSADTIYAMEDESFSYQILATDPRDLELTFSVGWMPHWLSFDIDSLYGMPLDGDLDTSFQLIAANGIANDTLLVTVLVTAVNEAPVISEIPNQTIYMNGSVSGLAFTMEDEETEADDLDLSITSSSTTLLPVDNIVRVGEDGSYALSLTPTQDNSGIALITLTVSDGENSTQSGFTLTVEQPNSAPVFSPAPLLTASEDSLYIYFFNVSDPDGDAFTLETELPTWLNYSMSSDNIINTIAGIGYAPHNGDYRTAVTASLQYPTGVSYMADGSILIADKYGYRIRKIGLNGIITTVAGTGSYTSSGDGGQATSAGLNHPNYVVSDIWGNIYIGEDDGRKIRKIDPDGYISTIAGNGSYGHSGDGGPATAAAIAGGGGICVDNSGNIFFIEPGYGKVRKIDSQGIISTIAGAGDGSDIGDGGAAIDASFNYPYGIAIDAQGNVYVSDVNHYRIRKIGVDGIISTIAGTGIPGFSGDGESATSAQIGRAYGLAVDASHNVYFTDAYNHRIRKIDANGIINTFAGNSEIPVDEYEEPQGDFSGDGGVADSAALYGPMDVAISPAGMLAIADTENRRIREISLPVHQLMGTPADLDTGSNSVILTADDGEDVTTLSFTIEVENINDPPSISSEPIVQAVEDQRFVYHGTAEDVDSESLMWQFLELPLWLTTDADSVFGTPHNWASDTSFTAIVSDGELSDTLQVMVGVTVIDDPPVITSPNSVVAIEDQRFRYTMLAEDEEAQALTFTTENLASWMTVVADTIFGTPDDGDLDTTFIVMVSDGNSSDTLDVSVSVLAMNDTPTLVTALGFVSIEEDESGAVVISRLEDYFEDTDVVDNLHFTALALNSGLDSVAIEVIAVSDTTQLSVYPEADFNGRVNILVEAIDDSLASVPDTLRLTVNPVNDAPVCGVFPDHSFPEDDTLRITLESLFPYVSDVDDSVGTLSWQFQGSDHITVTVGDASLLFSAEPDWFGSEQVGVRINDMGGLSDSALIMINVQSVNDAPMITTIPDTGFAEDGELQIALSELFEYVSDNEDADTVLVWSFTGFEHITATSLNDTLLLTSEANWYGSDTIQVVITDRGSLSDTANVTLHVTSVNDAPLPFMLVAPVDETEITAVDSTELTFRWEAAQDVELDELTYTLVLNTDEWDTVITSIDTTFHRFNIESLPRWEDINWTCWAIDGQDSTSASSTHSFQVSALVALDEYSGLPEEYTLQQNFPNPFNPTTTIRYGLPEDSDLSIVIYDVRGRVMQSWRYEAQPAGWYEQVWNGLDHAGTPVSTGLYLTRFQAGAHARVIKMLYLK